MGRGLLVVALVVATVLGALVGPSATASSPSPTTPTSVTTRVDSSTEDGATPFTESAATPANAEPAWVAIVVVVLLLSAVRIGSQLREQRAARRVEDG